MWPTRLNQAQESSDTYQVRELHELVTHLHHALNESERLRRELCEDVALLAVELERTAANMAALSARLKTLCTGLDQYGDQT